MKALVATGLLSLALLASSPSYAGPWAPHNICGYTSNANNSFDLTDPWSKWPASSYTAWEYVPPDAAPACGVSEQPCSYREINGSYQQVFDENGYTAFCYVNVLVDKDDNALGFNGFIEVTCDEGKIINPDATSGSQMCVTGTCPEGTTRDQYGQCVQDPLDCSTLQGQSAGSGTYNGDMSTPACIDGCEAEPTESAMTFTMATGQTVTAASNYTYTGQACQTGETLTQGSAEIDTAGGTLEPSNIPKCFYENSAIACPDDKTARCLKTGQGNYICDAGYEPKGSDGTSGGITWYGDINTTSGGPWGYWDGTGVDDTQTSSQTSGEQYCGGAGQPECGAEDVPGDPDLGLQDNPYGDLEARDVMDGYEPPISDPVLLVDRFGVIQSRACTPVSLGSLTLFGQTFGPFEIDICPWIDDIRAVIFLLLAGLAVIGIWESWFGAATGGKG